MTPEQIKNFRRGLSLGPIGAYALIMPESDLLKLHSKLQHVLDEEARLTDAPVRQRQPYHHKQQKKPEFKSSGPELGNIGGLFDSYKGKN
jgi:hypothetical protein